MIYFGIVVARLELWETWGDPTFSVFMQIDYGAFSMNFTT